MSSNLTHAHARESAAKDWLASKEDVPVRAEDALVEGFITGAEWGEGQAEAREAGRLNDAEVLMREAAELLRGYERHHNAKLPKPYDGPGRVASEPACTDEQLAIIEKAERNGLMAARLEGWLRGDRVFPITADGDYVAHAGFRSSNPADVLQTIAEGMVDGVTIRGVDYEAFEQARRQLEQPADFILPAGFDFAQLDGDVLVLPPDDKTVEDCKARFGDNVVVGLTFRGPTRGKRMDPEVMEGLLAASGQIDGSRRFGLQTPDPRFDPRAPLTINGYPFTPATEA